MILRVGSYEIQITISGDHRNFPVTQKLVGKSAVFQSILTTGNLT